MIDNKTIRKVIMLNKLQGGSALYEDRVAEGEIANFTTNTVQPFVSLDCEILPIQEGTGTPSPSNPRPISGTSVLDIYHSGSDTSDYDTTSVSLGQEIMGGSADVVGGTGSKTHGSVDLGTLEWTYHAASGQYSEFFDCYLPNDSITGTGSIAFDGYCSIYKSVPSNDIAKTGADNNVMALATTTRRFIVCDQRFHTKADFETAMSGIYLIYPLATPTDFTFTGQPIRSLLNVNNVWTEAGNTKVTYKYKTGEGGSSNKKYLPIFYDFYGKEKYKHDHS